MIQVKIIYDAYNRVFKLMDSESGSILEDGGRYELTLPCMVQNLGEDVEFIPLCDAPLPRA
jgi:hypothetical protein